MSSNDLLARPWTEATSPRLGSRASLGAIECAAGALEAASEGVIRELARTTDAHVARVHRVEIAPRGLDGRCRRGGEGRADGMSARAVRWEPRMVLRNGVRWKSWMRQDGGSPGRQTVADGVTRGATADYECERCIAR